MLSRLALTSRTSRKSSVNASDFANASENLKTLFEKKEAITPNEIIKALGGTDAAAFLAPKNNISDREIKATVCETLLNNLSEADWTLLMLLCDRCETHTPNSLLYQLAQKMLENDALTLETKTNAFFFLKSQNQTIAFNSKIIASILTSDNIEAWTVLLSDQSTQLIILSENMALLESKFDFLCNVHANMRKHKITQSLTTYLWEFILRTFLAKNNAQEFLPEFISQIKKENEVDLSKTIAFLFSESTIAIKKSLIELALSNVYKLKILREAVSSFSPTQEEIEKYREETAKNPMFCICLFGQISPLSDENSDAQITKTLAAFQELQEKFSNKTHELFGLFVEPVLRSHTKYLLATAQKILADHLYLLEAFTPLISAIPMSEQAVISLSAQALQLAQQWDFEKKLSEKILQECKGTFDTFSEQTQKTVQADLIKNVVRDIIFQLIFILTIPGVWNYLVENKSSELTELLEKILKHDKKDFFRSISTLPWNQKGERICSDQTIDWLFNLPSMIRPGIIQPDDPHFGVNGGIYLSNLLRFNDNYVTQKLYQANISSDFSFFKGFTKIGNFTEIKHAIIPVLTHPGFDIKQYYAGASEVFKQLPQVKSAMQLQHFFDASNTRALIAHQTDMTDITQKHDDETFFHELRYRHLDALHKMTQEIESIITYAAEDETLVKKAEKLHLRVKTLPNEAKAALNEDRRFVAFSFAYRILANLSAQASNPTVRAVKGFFTQALKGHTVVGKEAKTPFLAYILKHLIQHGACDAKNTEYTNAPFIWSVYVEAYIHVKRKIQNKPVINEDTLYSEEKMARVNIWLNEQILEDKKENIATKTLHKETEAIANLPLDIREAIFSNTTLRDEMSKLLLQNSNTHSERSLHGLSTSPGLRTLSPTSSFSTENIWTEVRASNANATAVITSCSSSTFNDTTSQQAPRVPPLFSSNA